MALGKFIDNSSTKHSPPTIHCEKIHRHDKFTSNKIHCQAIHGIDIFFNNFKVLEIYIFHGSELLGGEFVMAVNFPTINCWR